MRQAQVIPVIVEDERARELVQELAPGLYERMIQIIESTASGIEVRQVGILTTHEPEDAQWMELVFEVRVNAQTEVALEYWVRASEKVQDWIDEAVPEVREQLVNLVSLHVDW